MLDCMILESVAVILSTLLRLQQHDRKCHVELREQQPGVMIQTPH